jgi:hypothetical protein
VSRASSEPKRELTVQPAPALRACPDISLFVVPGAAHNHNIAPNRTVLWDRMAGRAEGLR